MKESSLPDVLHLTFPALVFFIMLQSSKPVVFMNTTTSYSYDSGALLFHDITNMIYVCPEIYFFVISCPFDDDPSWTLVDTRHKYILGSSCLA